MAPGRPVKIVAFGIPLADREVWADDAHPQARAVFKETMARHGMRFEEKHGVSPEIYAQFAQAAAGQHEAEAQAGGSAVNVMMTLGQMFPGGKEAQLSFWGAVGNDADGKRIRKILKGSDIDLKPNEYDAGLWFNPSLRTAQSLIIRGNKGKRLMVNCADEAINAMANSTFASSHLADVMQNADVALVQGKMWRFHGGRPDAANALPDRILEERWDQNKDLWLMLPSDISYDPEKSRHFQFVIPGANMVFGNAEELSAVMMTPEDAGRLERFKGRLNREDLARIEEIQSQPRSPDARGDMPVLNGKGVTYEDTLKYDFKHSALRSEESLRRLQALFRLKRLEVQPDDSSRPKWQGNTFQMGLITLGKQGAAVVTADGIQRIEQKYIANSGFSPEAAAAGAGESNKIINKTGGSDIATAAFIGGLCTGQEVKDAADAAMRAAAGKLRLATAGARAPLDALRHVALGSEEFHLPRVLSRQSGASPPAPSHAAGLGRGGDAPDGGMRPWVSR